MKKTIFVISTVLFFRIYIFSGYGGEPVAFLKNGLGVRATSLGCAFTSIAND